MNKRYTISTGILTSTALATALSLFSTATLAAPPASIQTGDGKSTHLLLAYSAKSGLSYRNKRKAIQQDKSSFSSFEGKVDSNSESKAMNQATHRHHHGSPYSRKH